MKAAETDPAQLAWQTWLLGIEAAQVIWLRSWVLMAGGPRAVSESQRMVGEKVVASLTLLPALVGGGPPASPQALGARAVAHYARPVRANRRRLAQR